MPEPTVETVAKEIKREEPVGVDIPKKESSLPDHYTEEDKAFIKSLRTEAADNRVKKNEVQKELDGIKEQIQKQNEAKLKEDGKLQELLDAKELELADLSSVRDENESFKKYFTDQLEVELSKLTEMQRELINDTKMDIEKKLKWAKKLQEQDGALKAPPDGARPGGKAPTEKINVADYIGPEGQRKLVELSRTNPTLFEAIIKEKNKK